MYTMLVIVEWHGRELGIKLEQIEAVEIDDEREEAISEWHYWVNRGYQIC